MKSKVISHRFKIMMGLGLMLIVFSVMFLPSTQPASANINVTATTSGNVTFSVTDGSIAFGSLNLATWTDTASIGGETRKVWDSENDIGGTPDSAVFNESTTNVNASWYLTVSGQTVAGKDSTNWLYFKNKTNTFDPDGSNTAFGAYGSYWLPTITGTLGTSTAGYTAPTGETISLTVAISVTFLGSTDGNDWKEGSVTLYIIKTTTNKIYIDDDQDFADTTEGGFISEVGPLTTQYAQATIFGNPWILIDDPASLSASSTITFRFGWQKNYDGIAGNQPMEFYALLAIPLNAPATSWTWTITINGVQYLG